MSKKFFLPPPEELKASINAYFASCDETRERTTLKSGAVTYRQIPYTLAGLCAYTGLDRELIRRCCEGKFRGAHAAEAHQIFTDACRRIEQYTVERMLLGELNAGVAELLLKDIGVIFEEKAPSSDRQLQVILDDKEDWSQ